MFSKDKFSPCFIIKGINNPISPVINASKITMVTTTAMVFLNFKRFFKNKTIGLPIREITKAITI